MIMSVEEFKKFAPTDIADAVIEAKLQALEVLIRRYTNNNFQKRSYRRNADIVGGLFMVEALTPFKAGDTVQITESDLNEGLFTVKEADASTFTVNEDVEDDKDFLSNGCENGCCKYAEVGFGEPGQGRYTVRNHQ